MPTPVRVHTLTPAGCLIEFHAPEHRDQRVQLEVALPHDGWISVDAEVLNIQRGRGYVACFVNVPREIEARVERAIQRLQREAAIAEPSPAR